MKSLILLLLFLLSLSQVFAVTCEGGCSTSDAIGGSGCAVQSQGSCMMKLGTECIVLKNNTGKSHFIPAKEGKRDWENFKSVSNKERFTLSACPVINTPPTGEANCQFATYDLRNGTPETGGSSCMSSVLAAPFDPNDLTNHCQCTPVTTGAGNSTNRSCSGYTAACDPGATGQPPTTPPPTTPPPTSEPGTCGGTCTVGAYIEYGEPFCSRTGPFSPLLFGGESYTVNSKYECDSKCGCDSTGLRENVNCTYAENECGPTCTESGWAPDPTNTCSTETVAQTSNCGTTRTVQGTKSCAATCDANTTAPCECYFMWTNPGAIETESQGTLTSAACEARVGKGRAGASAYYKCEWNGCDGRTFGSDPGQPANVLCWQGGPDPIRNDCTTAGSCPAQGATTRPKCKDIQRNNGETYEAYYTLSCQQATSLSSNQCVQNGGGVGSTGEASNSCWWDAVYTAPYIAPSSVGDVYECAGVERTCTPSNMGQKINCIPGMGSDPVQKGNITCQCNASAPPPVTGPAACPQSPMPTPIGQEAYQFCGCGNNPVWTKIRTASGQNLANGC